MNIYPSHFTSNDRTPFTYFLRHIPTGDMYYGSKTAKGCKPEHLWTSYFSNSRIVKQLLETDGASAFEAKVSRIFKDVNICRAHETRFLTKMNAADSPNWLNRHNGDKKFSTAGKPGPNLGKSMSEETKKRIAESKKGSTPWNKGIPRTDAEKLKMSLSHTGSFASDETKKKLSDLRKGEKHPLFGKHRSEETKNKQSIAMKGRPSSITGRISVTNGLKHCFIDELNLPQFLSNGFMLGKGCDSIQTKINKSKSRIGTHMVNNGKVQHYVKGEKLSEYLSNGFQLGRLKR
jgi:hypothetical protein